jgi:membrane dipeptidase
MIPDGVGDVAGLPVVLDALAGTGFDGRELTAIAHGNWRRVLAAWWHR